MALATIAPLLLGATPSASARGAEVRLIVELAPGYTAGSLPGDHVVTEIDERFVAVSVDDGERAQLAASPAVAELEQDGVARAARVPNDPCWTGCSTSVPGAGDAWDLERIGADLAWDVSTGTPSITVAVLDSGVRGSHADLAGRVTAVVVDPGLGTTDVLGHGTAVAGLIAAAGDNGVATAGLAWTAQVRSYKVLDDRGDGFLSTIAAAINTAVADGVRVINLSLTTSTDNEALHRAIQSAHAHGVAVVVAAGNVGSQVAESYPGRYEEAIAVASITRTGRRAEFSNHGPWVDLAAPGVDLVSLAASDDLGVVAAGGTGKGTSFSAALVSGTAALILAQNPNLSATQVRARLANTAVPLGDPGLGGGMVDAGSAVRLPGPGSPSCAAPPSGWMLDGYGGLHRFGVAPTPTGGPYWPGWDIARDVALGPAGGYVLDGFGGIHPVSGAPRVTGSGYWPGWDIGRAIVSRPDGQGTYVLDGFGGIHLGRTPGSTATAPATSGYWPGWDIARDLALDPTDPTRGWVLDGYGGLHPIGGAPAPVTLGFHPGLDIARSIVVAADGRSGYVLSSDGTLAPWAVPGEPLPPRRYAASTEPLLAREVVYAGGDPAAGFTVTGSGRIVPLQGPPCWTVDRWPFDIGRAFAVS